MYSSIKCIDQYTLMVHTFYFEEYSAENVTVTMYMEWLQQLGAVYNVSVHILPLAPSMINGSSSVQLVLEYNTEYNISVVALGPCGVNATAAITLNYGEVFEQLMIIHSCFNACTMS